jgi:hypothetical protein
MFYGALVGKYCHMPLMFVVLFGSKYWRNLHDSDADRNMTPCEYKDKDIRPRAKVSTGQWTRVGKVEDASKGEEGAAQHHPSKSKFKETQILWTVWYQTHYVFYHSSEIS